ncbi:hypothetical protein BXY58_3040 [Epilithonimonas arachidiradicis]|uniref:Uncharacterized protein n=1 Tax=Epilithonimonas arachidiradicis TaxID=1617282 RepID=A0A420CMQ9_9FLAO|nr:hypothetical protein BXY58_3040 [Epilithonimonas arachidiradicis]
MIRHHYGFLNTKFIPICKFYLIITKKIIQNILIATFKIINPAFQEFFEIFFWHIS